VRQTVSLEGRCGNNWLDSQGRFFMDRYSFPIRSILAATAAIGIASVAAPVRAAPGYITGLAGSVCAGVQQVNFSKLSVPPNGLISNKSTTATASINCPMAAETGTFTTFYVTWTKKDSQSLTCTLYRRDFDYLGGSSNTASSTFNGSGYFVFSTTANYFNSWQCTIPRNNGSGQNNINGVLWAN
jgi:hypothetical protein